MQRQTTFRLTHQAGMALLAAVLAAGAARVAAISSLNLTTDLGITTASPTRNIVMATTFTMGPLQSGSNETGIFLGMPPPSFGSVSFNTASLTGLTFGNTVFGQFASTPILNSGGAVVGGGASQAFVVGETGRRARSQVSAAGPGSFPGRTDHPLHPHAASALFIRTAAARPSAS